MSLGPAWNPQALLLPHELQFIPFLNPVLCFLLRMNRMHPPTSCWPSLQPLSWETRSCKPCSVPSWEPSPEPQGHLRPRQAVPRAAHGG